MIAARPESVSARRKALSAAIYAAAVLGLVGYALATGKALLDARSDVAALRERLAALTARARGGAGAAANSALSAPFLREPTVTLAGAALQQRVEQAIAKAGGALQSDEIELDGPGAKDGFIRMSASLEIAQSGLQPLLYDLEAGMPYLFVEALDLQSPQALGEAEKSAMRVGLTVSSKWEPAL
jgi:general secretion pathway protein M